MIEKINPTIPIPITSSPIPDEQREIIMAKSSIAIPNPIFFIVNPPLQIPICFSISYSNYTIKLVNNSYGFQLVTHQPFQNAQKVVEAPFAQTSLKKIIENVEQRTLIKSTSIGQILMAQQQELFALLHEFYDF